MSGTASPTRLRAILLFVVIFAAGTVFGSALTIGIGRRILQRTTEGPGVAWNLDVMRRLERRLDLTPEQRANLQPILADMSLRLRETRIQSRRAWMAVLQDTRDQVREQLTPQQQVEFDRMAARTREGLGRILGGQGERPGERIRAQRQNAADTPPEAGK